MRNNRERITLSLPKTFQPSSIFSSSWARYDFYTYFYISIAVFSELKIKFSVFLLNLGFYYSQHPLQGVAVSSYLLHEELHLLLVLKLTGFHLIQMVFTWSSLPPSITPPVFYSIMYIIPQHVKADLLIHNIAANSILLYTSSVTDWLLLSFRGRKQDS